MNEVHQLYQIISAYRDDRLSKEGRKQFEIEMNDDPSLKQLVKDFPLIVGIDSKGRSIYEVI